MHLSKVVAAVGFAMLASTAAEGVLYTYAAWERETPAARALYIAGAFDSLVGFGGSAEDQITGSHYSTCLALSRMSNSQLADNVRQYASTRPNMQGGSVLHPFINT